MRDGGRRSGKPLLCQLAAHVEQMVLHFVHGVDRDPTQRPFRTRGKVVHERPLPFARRQTGEIVGEHLRRVGELSGDVGGILLRAAVVVDPLLSTHRVERRAVRAPRREHSLPLYEEDVAQMTRVLERGPHRRAASRAQIGGAVPQGGHELNRARDDRARGGRCGVEVVLEPALPAPLHAATIERTEPTGKVDYRQVPPA
jgi:hypothetical protein